MGRFTKTEIREFEAMKKEQENKKNGNAITELEKGVDLILINENDELQSIDVWIDLKNVERIKNRMKKLERESGDKAVAVKTGSIGWSSYNLKVGNLLDLMVEV